MSFELQLPNIQAATPGEKQLYAYLHRTVQQLNWALQHLDTAPVSPRTQGSSAAANPSENQAQEQFSQLKSLIIKSADIVNAYYDTIRARLEGVYVASSEFGDYVDATALALEADSQRIDQNYTKVQGLQTQTGSLLDKLTGIQNNMGAVTQALTENRETVDAVKSGVSRLDDQVDRLNTVILETNAYIRTGLLEEGSDGIPVYGLEIGQTNGINGREVFNKYARFSSSRLSFYDQNDTEVAYISDYRLCITNARVSWSLRVGSYELDASDGLAFRPMEGEN